MEKIWYKSYDPGVPHTINPDQYASIPEMLEESFNKFKNNPCFTNFDEVLTFKEVDELSQAYAGFLQTECKLQKGDRVAIMMPNTLQYPVALFGALRAGMVNVNINPLYSSDQVHHALCKTGAKCILVLENFAHILQPALIGTQVKYVIVTEIGDLFRPMKRLIFNFVIKYIKKMVPKWDIPDTIPFRSTIQPRFRELFKKPEHHGEDLAYLQFTEGRETGSPKCAMITHKNFIANALQVSAFIDSFFKQKHELGVLVPLPFFKINPLTVNCLNFMHAGMINHLISDPRNISLLLKEMRKYPISAMLLVRTIFNALIFEPAFNNVNHSTYKFTFSAGMSIPHTLADRWEEKTHCIILEGYAITETSPMALLNPLSSKSFTGYAGLPLPSSEVKICNDANKELPLDEIGEIWIKGPQVVKGYWNDPELTKKVFTEDGWFKTGDFGTINAQGYVTLIDRKEDIIHTEHGNVYPHEVEDVIAELSGVEEAVVVQYKLTNNIKAYIVRSDFSLTKEHVINHCSRQLVGYKVPTEIEFCEQLPKSPTGFILRRVLRGQG
jgi:long-chain acyl-CoA synthetase